MKNLANFQFQSHVIRGKNRSRQEDFFPTINLEIINKEKNFLENYSYHGVYLVEALIGKEIYIGLLHFGPKKTFEEGNSIELLIPEFIFEIERKNVKIKIIKKIRNIYKFKNISELKKQIQVDLDQFL